MERGALIGRHLAHRPVLLRYAAVRPVCQVHNSQTSYNEPGLYADRITPRAALLWQPREWLSLYSSYVESYGPVQLGALTPPTPTSEYVLPSTGTQAEYGVKTSFYGGKLTARAVHVLTEA